MNIQATDRAGRQIEFPSSRFGEGLCLGSEGERCEETGLIICHVRIITSFINRRTYVRDTRVGKTKLMLLSPQIPFEHLPSGQFRVIYDRMIFGNEMRVIAFAISFGRLFPDYNPDIYPEWVKKEDTQPQDQILGEEQGLPGVGEVYAL